MVPTTVIARFCSRWPTAGDANGDAGVPSGHVTTHMTQTAPYPVELHDLVERLRYRPGWTFQLKHMDRGQGSEGLTLVVTATVPDSYHPQDIQVCHYMIVPAASYDRRAWRWWLFQQCRLVDSHEAAELFRIAEDGDDADDERLVRPFAPNHAPGRDPYQLLELGAVEDAETDFRGIRHDGTQQIAGM